MSVYGISGKIGSGKDTVAQMIQDLERGKWEVKKFAGRLKQIVHLLTGIPVEDLEKQEVKDSYLGPEWNYWQNTLTSEFLPNKVYSGSRPDTFYERKQMSVRELLQKLGTNAMRDVIHQNIHVNALFSDYYRSSNWIISDMRFENELEAVRAKGGATIRVVRPDKVSMDQHPSETALDNAEFDYVIINDGTLEELLEKVKNILCRIK